MKTKKKINKKKTKSGSSITIPREILEKVLEYGSLFGPTTQDRTRHAQIPTLKLLFSDNQVKCYGRRKDGLSFVYFAFKDDNIKGSGEIYIGDVIKIIGGRDINRNRFTGVISRLDENVTIDVVGNQVVFDMGKNYDVSISLIDPEIAKNYVIEEDTFLSKIHLNDENTEIDKWLRKDSTGFCQILGSYLKDVMDDAKTSSSTEFLHFCMKANEESFRMKIGNAQRSMSREIPYDNSKMESDIDGLIYNGLEAFSNAISEENFVSIYQHKGVGFLLFQRTENHDILMVTGAKKE